MSEETPEVYPQTHPAMAVARNLTNQILDRFIEEYGGGIKPLSAIMVRQAINDECDQFAARLLTEYAAAPETCEMVYEEPMDFASCLTHDETFPLGEECRFNGRVMWEVFAEEADQQRQRAVMTEMSLGRVKSLVARWKAEAAERGPMDTLYADGVVRMLEAAIIGEQCSNCVNDPITRCVLIAGHDGPCEA